MITSWRIENLGINYGWFSVNSPDPRLDTPVDFTIDEL